MWEEKVGAEEVKVFHANTTQIGVMKRSWPWLVICKRSRLHWNKSSIHMPTWFLQHSNGTSYQMTYKQSHTPKFKKLAKCAKTSGTTSMVIGSRFQITTKVFVITLHLGIWHWKNETNSICQNSTMKIDTMRLRLSKRRENSMF